MNNEEKIISMLEHLLEKIEKIEAELVGIKAGLGPPQAAEEDKLTPEEQMTKTGIDILRMKF